MCLMKALRKIFKKSRIKLVQGKDRFCLNLGTEAFKAILPGDLRVR